MTVETRGEPARATMLVLCPYPVGVAAGQRLKFEQYYADWRAAGYEVDISPFMDIAMWRVLYSPGHYLAKAVGVLKGYGRRLADLLRIRRYDLVYIHMWATPFGTSLFERLVRRLAKRIVFDLEDNVLTDALSGKVENPNPILRYLKGTEKPRYLVEQADHVITSSPFLNERCLELNRRRACTYISSSIDTERFLPASPYSNEQRVTIGWTGTFSTRPMLDLLRPVFQELARRMDFRLKVIGNFDYDLPGVDLTVVRWSAEREVADLQELDIGVYPLPVDDWVMGKSGLKAIQYMAFGLPVVATNVGTTPLLIRDGENGLLVRSEDEWLTALETLIREPELRRRLGTAARASAVAKHSTRAVAGDYRRVLEDAVGIR
jgi:glycosyltransferase involved in cell wall biosynthesis